MEQWETIRQNRAYEISNLGRVRKGSLILKLDFNPSNRKSYPRINLWKQGKPQRYSVHLLVAQEFLGPKPKGLECNHKDGNKGNPRLENLEYVTKSENHKHSFRVLGQIKPKGSLHGMSKLTEKDILEIRSLRSNIHEAGVPWKGKGKGLRIRHQPGSGKTLKEISERFDIGTSMISLIVNRRNWTHI